MPITPNRATYVISDAAQRKLKVLATKERRSMSAQVQYLIELAYAAMKKESTT